MSLQRKVRELLEDFDLQPTDEHVAIMLRVAGIKGKRHNTRQCPIANFIKRRIKKYGIINREITVGTTHFIIYDKNGGTYRLPKQVENFIDKFDLKYYQDLES